MVKQNQLFNLLHLNVFTMGIFYIFGHWQMHCLAEVTANLCAYKLPCTTMFNTNCSLANVNLLFLLSDQSWVSTGWLGYEVH